jgi:ubiquinone/menaquinone biosynthesis C-methylase UbiE
MSLGRRKVALDDPRDWVFNRIAHAYDARPPYPDALLELMQQLAGPDARVGDLGAGIGHLALPLAARGCRVVAVEPAQAMLARLQSEAQARSLALTAMHGQAEALPLAAASLDLAIVADALHFLDAERAGREIGRVLATGGTMAVVFCQLGDTPFMRALLKLMEESAPRRPRRVAQPLKQLAAVAQVTLTHEQHLSDHTEVDHPTLERILRSISFIGPAMNGARFAAFTARVRALSIPPVWSRDFTIHWGPKR